MADAGGAVASAQGLYDEGNVEAALSEAEKAREIAEGAGNLGLVADATRIIVGAHRQVAEKSQAKPEQAERIAQESLDRFRGLGRERDEAVILLALSEIYGESRHSKRRTSAERWAKKALTIFKRLGERLLAAEALNQLAAICRKEQELEDAWEMSAQAVHLAGETGELRVQALCLHGLALGQAACSDFEEAVKNEEAALQLVEKLGIKNMEALGLCQVAQWNLTLGKLSVALTQAQKAMKAKAGNKETLTTVQALTAAGKFQEALDTAKKGVERAKKSNDKREEAGALRVLVAAYLAQDFVEQAVQAYEDTLTIARSLNDHIQELQLLQAIAVVYSSRGLLQKAESPLREALSVCESPAEKGVILRTLSEMKVDMGQYDEALVTGLDAAASFQEDGDRSGEAGALMLVASAHNLAQNPEKALQVAKTAYEIAFVAGDCRREAIALQMLAEMHLAQGRFQDAVDSYVKAADANTAAGDSAGAAGILVKLGELYCEVNRFTDAADVAKQAQEFSLASANAEGDALSQILMARVSHKQYEAAPDPGTQEWFLTSMRMASSQAVMSAGKMQNTQLQGVASYTHAQAMMLGTSPQMEEAMKLAKRAQVLFKDSGDVRGEVFAAILVGTLMSARGENDRGKDVLEKALKLAREAGDTEAETNVQSTMDALEAAKAGRAPPAARGRPGRAGDAAGPEAAGLAATSTGAPAAAVAVKLDPGDVKSKLMDLVRNAIGTGEDVEADAALMDAGMDSLSATDFTGQVAREFRLGASPSLVFDFPTVGEIVQHVLQETSGS